MLIGHLCPIISGLCKLKMDESVKTEKTATSKLPLIFERVTTLLLALMTLVPFLVWHHQSPITSFYPQISAIVIGMLAVLMFLTKKHWHPVKLPLIALLPLGLAVILGVQFLLDMHTYWQQHFVTVLVLAWASMMAVVGANISQARVIPLLAMSMLIGGVLSVLVVFLQIQGWTDVAVILPHIKGGYSANIAQVNHAATYFALALVSTSYLLLTGRIEFLAWLAISMLLVAALVLTGQRMAILYVVVISSVGWLIAVKSQLRPKRAYCLIALLPVYLLLDWLLPILMGGTMNSPVSRLLETAGNESTRLILLQQAWQMFTESPLLGVGWGQFGWHNFQLTEAYPGINGYTDNAHNIVFHLLAETGGLGGGLFIIMLLAWFVAQTKTTLSMERWWIIVALTILGIHSLLEYPLWYAYFLGIAALLAGMGETRTLDVSVKTGPVIAIALLFFAIVTSTSTIRQYQELENWYTEGRQGHFDDEEAVQLLYELANRRAQSLFAPFFDVIIVRALPNTEELAADKLAMNMQLMRYLPSDIEVYTHVDLLVKTGQTDAAAEQLAKAIRHYPEKMDSYWKSMTQSLIAERDKRYFPLILQLQDYQDEYLGIKDYR